MIIKIKNDTGAEILARGTPIAPGAWYQIQHHELLNWQFDDQIAALISDGSLIVGNDDYGLEIQRPSTAMAFLRSSAPFPSSFAIDKEEIDQSISTDASTKITAERILWDLGEDFDLAESKFIAPVNGVWNANGTILINNFVNVSRLNLEIWRNDELWFVVGSWAVNTADLYAVFSCDVDAYKTSSHEFDLRIRMEKIIPLDACSAVISGLAEHTSWGMTFLCINEAESSS